MKSPVSGARTRARVLCASCLAWTALACSSPGTGTGSGSVSSVGEDPPVGRLAPPAVSQSVVVGAWVEHPLYLRIDAGGTYTVDIVNIVDGCGTVKGNGYSTGRWERDAEHTDGRERIRFVPTKEWTPTILVTEEPDDLWMSFAGVSAEFVDGALALDAPDGRPWALARSDQPSRGMFGAYSDD